MQPKAKQSISFSKRAADYDYLFKILLLGDSGVWKNKPIYTNYVWSFS